MKRHLFYTACAVAIIVTACIGTTTGETSETRFATQERAAELISALDHYRTDRGRYPEALGDLIPDYLDQIPLTMKGAEYQYRLNPVDGYLLCFKAHIRRDLSCCFTPHWSEWECSAGDH